MKNLDFQTACVIYIVSNACIALFLGLAFCDGRARGARRWIAGLGAQILGVGLLAARGLIADWLSIALANTLLAGSWSLFWASFDAFFGNRRPVWQYLLAPALAIAAFSGWLDRARPRIVIGCSMFAVQAWIIAATVLARLGEFRSRVIIMLAVGYLLGGLSSAARVAGILVAAGPNPAPFMPSLYQDLSMLLAVPSMIVCSLGFVLLHRERVECEVRHLAATDYLTGLCNRRGFEAAFARELRQAAHTGTWTSLALLDIDHFKAVNDRHGHGMGDKALKELARLISRELRAGDSVARIGGDEFCILLPRADQDKAAAVAERLRSAVAGHDWHGLGLSLSLTVTIGLASHRGGPEDDGADFFQLADMALLAAKDMARDMVLHADQLSGKPVTVTT